MAKWGVLFWSFTSTSVLGFTLRWLRDLSAPWSISDEPVFLSASCCGAVTLLAICVFVVCLVKVIRSWKVTSDCMIGAIIWGAFVYTAFPLVAALLISPSHRAPKPGQIFDLDCVRMREMQLASRYDQPFISQRWLDIDGDGELERWEKIEAAIGGTGYGGAVFIYEGEEATPFWCGHVLAWNSFVPAWIYLINLDLDFTPEIWMRDADDTPLPLSAFTVGFWDFSVGKARAFNPSPVILFVLLPLRALPLFIWFIFRRKLIPSIIIAALTILAYVLVP